MYFFEKSVLMRPPATIRPHLSINEMFQWLQNAPDEGAHKRRMAVWLTHTGNLHAKQVAKIVGVSTQAVWLWIRQYNDKGPAGLERAGRGGRRWSLMTIKQEADILKPYIRKLHNGDVTSPLEIKKAIEQKLEKTISMPYVYRLLQRHRWSDIIAQSSPKPSSQQKANEYLKVAMPWLRNS